MNSELFVTLREEDSTGDMLTILTDEDINMDHLWTTETDPDKQEQLIRESFVYLWAFKTQAYTTLSQLNRLVHLETGRAHNDPHYKDITLFNGIMFARDTAGNIKSIYPNGRSYVTDQWPTWDR